MEPEKLEKDALQKLSNVMTFFKQTSHRIFKRLFPTNLLGALLNILSYMIILSKTKQRIDINNVPVTLNWKETTR